MPAIVIELSEQAAGRLEMLCKRSSLTQHALAAQAIQHFVETEEWQLADIEHGLEEARQGHLVSEEQAGILFNQLLS